MKRTSRKRWPYAVLLAFAASMLCVIAYIRSNPLVFNESSFQHAHCISQARQVLSMYAETHNGRFPTHPEGYANALLLMPEDMPWYALTGPGYDPKVLADAKARGTKLSEEECGRVYVQGLTVRSNPKLVLLFDKLPSPGGDHCHLPARIWAPLAREVLFVSGEDTVIRESDWPDFARQQVELLVQEGWPRQEAERLYAQKAR